MAFGYNDISWGVFKSVRNKATVSHIYYQDLGGDYFVFTTRADVGGETSHYTCNLNGNPTDILEFETNHKSGATQVPHESDAHALGSQGLSS